MKVLVIDDEPALREVLRRTLTLDGYEVTLAVDGNDALGRLLRNPRQVLSRQVIFERVWGFDFGPSSNSLEVCVGYPRRNSRRPASRC